MREPRREEVSGARRLNAWRADPVGPGHASMSGPMSERLSTTQAGAQQNAGTLAAQVMNWEQQTAHGKCTK